MPKAKLWLPRTSRTLCCLKNDVLWNLGPKPQLNVSLGCTLTSSRQLLSVWLMLGLCSFLSILRYSGSCKLLPKEGLCVQCTFCASPSGPFFSFLSLSLSLSCSIPQLLAALLNGGCRMMPTLQGRVPRSYDTSLNVDCGDGL